MHFSVVSAILFAVSAIEYARPEAPLAYARPAVSADPAYPRTYADGLILDNGGSDDAFSIRDITLTPSVPMPGQELDIHLVGKLKKVIDKGSKVGIKIGHNGVSVVNVELDACELAKDRKFAHQCPAQPEDFNVHHTLKVPGGAPKGDYSINAYGFNQDNVRVFNVSIFYNSPGVDYY